MTWAIMILDLPFTTPMLSETSKMKKTRFWSIGLFFYPSIAFFYKTQILIRINIFFQDLQKTILRCVSSPCVRKNNFPFEARHFVWNLLTCRKLQNYFGNDPTNVMLFLLLLLWKHSCDLCILKETTGCVGKKSVQLQIHVGVFESGDLHGFPTKMGIN